LIFCGAHPNHLCYLRASFICFEAASGLKINIAKSELVPLENAADVDGLANILGCGISSLPLSYLGLPLRVFFKAKSSWDGVIEKMSLLRSSIYCIPIK
jgi:hypothetical protein